MRAGRPSLPGRGGGLHKEAGSTAVHELHGSLFRLRCTQCSDQVDVARRSLREMADGLAQPLPKLGRRADDVLRLFTHVAMLAVALIFVTYGYQFAKFGSIQTSEIAGLPMLSIYIAWPLAGLTWLAFLGEKFIEDIKVMRGDTLPPRAE